MDPTDSQGSKTTSRVTPAPRRPRPTIGELMIVVAGIGVGLAVGLPIFRDETSLGESFVVLGGAVLGGASLVGVPLLLWERRRGRHRRFRSGTLLWFAHGTAAWLLWPPIIVGRRSSARGQSPPIVDPSAAEICFFYGTPLMAVYVTASLLAGGWLRRRRRGTRRSPAPMHWRERFGLLLGMGWAVIGLYVLSMIYRSQFR
ncbi:hypothetical protein [Tautonia rosea]|uniref:hypothetical protein n=1 Tax=Tautonia rosea TaxID=2728037 RepID=UPI00147669AE|nr:hypothetical protein [Tautonia rosea]